MRISDGVMVAVAAAALMAASLGLLWYEARRSSPEPARYVNYAYGFSLELPGEWAGQYYAREFEQGSRTEFWFRAPEATPEFMFEVGVLNDVSWQARYAQEPQRVRELGRRGSDVFYAHWAVSNPYQGETAVAYYRAMQLVPLALDSFRFSFLPHRERESAAAVACRDLPVFEDYPAGPAHAGVPAVVDFTSEPAAREFLTAITAAQAGGPNFAGHYAVASWACGTSCQQNAVVDAASGRIVAFNVGSEYGVDYRLDSRLLVVNPPERLAESRLPVPKPAESGYYEMTSLGELAEICAIPVPGLPTAGGNGTACIQVITPARNPETGEERDFPTPCDVPQGWEAARPEPL